MPDTLQRLVQDLTSRLGARVKGATLLAHPVADHSQHFVALSNDASPVLLISSSAVQGIVAPPFRLRGIDIAYGVPCTLEFPDGKLITRTLTTITCTTSDPLERSFFVDSSEILLRAIGDSPSLDTVIAATHHLANVFQRLDSPARESVTGIIGELLVIDLSPNPTVAIDSWRQHPEDRYDFSLENIRLEVKSTSNRTRIHHLTYEQCDPPDGSLGLLASITVESAGGGQSLTELIESIERRTAAYPRSIFRLREVIAETLGDTLVRSLSERFDRAQAEASIALFDLTAIPAIRGPLPHGVTQLKFRSDTSLSNTVSVFQFLAAYPRVADLLRP